MERLEAELSEAVSETHEAGAVTTLLDVPADVLLMIAQAYLAPRDVASLMGTCSDLRSTLMDDCLWHTIYRQFFTVGAWNEGTWWSRCCRRFELNAQIRALVR